MVTNNGLRFVCCMQVPTLFFALQHPNTTANWGYHAEKSKYASKSLKRGSYWPRGKMLGGSHGLNAMVHVRGSDRDFNDWESFGNPGWGWKDALYYFKKSEGLRIKDVTESNYGKFHNTDGPLKIDSYHNKEPVRDVVFQAGAELGYKKLLDINAEEYIGMTTPPGTLDGNRRCTTAKAFLVPAMNRPNFKVVKNAHVTKVLINNKKEATGVEFILNNRKFKVNAKKEVIVSTGSINTPQILMLSGIGPKQQLEQHKVPTIANLPVGKNLEDHTVVIYPLTYNKHNSTAVNPSAFLDTLFKYTNNQYNTAGNGVFDVLGFFNTADRNGKYPDLETHYNYFKRGENVLLPKYLEELIGFEENVAKSIIAANQDSDILFVLHILLNPKSSGEVKLRSADTYDAPIIDGNYFANDEDVKTLVRGLKLTHEFIGTKAFREAGMEAVPMDIPDCNQYERFSDEYFECVVRHMSTTLYHPTGTAKMGPATDKSSVVDSRLRVHGIKNLRVADGSVMPKITSANTNAPIVMIGEKAADLIKEDWGATIHQEL